MSVSSDRQRASSTSRPVSQPSHACLATSTSPRQSFFAAQRTWYQKSFTSWSNRSWVGAGVSMLDGLRSGNEMPSA